MEISEKQTKPGTRCKTKYPVLLVHGTGLRDFKHIKYWGRIPAALEKEGAVIFYGGQESWATIETNAAILKDTLLHLLEKTGAEKVNIIAHSKGGLDVRYMLHHYQLQDKIASLTTISTPHYGSKTMDKFYYWPPFLFHIVGLFVNTSCRLMGDKKPDFYQACRQFSTYFCDVFNKEVINDDRIYYQSYASVMKNSFSDILLAIPHFIVRRVDGENDGLVTAESAKWGEFKGVIKGSRLRGVSHADVVDLRRRNYGGLDIREVYLKILDELKGMGF